MRKILLPLLIVTMILSLAGCNFGMVESVQVIADPTVEIALGTMTDVFTDEVDMEGEIQTMVDDMDGVERTDSTTGETITLSMTEEMISISIDDFAGENMELDAINETIDEVSFEIPDISVSESVSQGFDPIDLPIDASIPTIDIETIPEVDGSATQSTPNITATGFDSLTFASGTLTGNIAVSGGSGSQTVQITSATIVDSSDTDIVSANNTPITATDDLDFDLTGVTLPSTFTMDLEVTVSGATLGNTFDLAVSCTFSGDTTVSAAEGITVDESVTDSISIPLSNSELVEATIDDGEVDIDLTFDSGWSGLTQTMDLTMTQGGSTISSVTGVTIGDDPEWDLSGVTIGNGNITLDYTIYVESTSANSATFSVSSGTDEITGTAAASVTSFSSVVMDASEMDFDNSITNDIGSDITDLVDVITFDENANISLSLINDLPTGSDITVTINAPELEISNEAKTFTANTTAGTENTQTWAVLSTDHTLDITSDLDDSDLNGTNDIDFDLSISLSNYDDATQQLTLTNVSANESYSLSGSVTANLDIASVNITGGNVSDQYPGTGDDPLDFSEIGDFLPDELSFSDIAASMELDFGGNSSISFDAMIYAEYSDGTSTFYENLVGVDADDNGIPESAESFDSTSDSPDLSGLANIINDRASDIIIYYDVDITSATVSLDETADEQNVSATVLATIPMALEASANASLEDEDGFPLIEAADEDLFGRDGSSDDEDLNDYLDMVSAATIEVTFENPIETTDISDGEYDLLGIGFTMTEATNPTYDDGTEYASFELTEYFILVAGESTTLEIDLTADQIERMVEDDEFMPSYDIYLMGPTDTDGDGTDDFDGTHKLVNGFDMDLSVTMTIQSDVDYTYDFGGDE
ncbi:MAG: hypothetical protein PQJ59_14870 [Spirochaetales bacterium]|nr:hypothetical protein [Spirochaetales bacterium]